MATEHLEKTYGERNNASDFEHNWKSMAEKAKDNKKLITR